jgi:cyclase
MHNIRIIPRLDIKGSNLVKGVHLEGLRVLGSPEKFAEIYYEEGADEIIYMDVVASLYGRNSLHDIIRRTSKNIFIPLTVGGGLRTIDDIRSVLRAGADKVSINTAAIANPRFISEAAKKFGSSTIIVSIETIKQSDGTYMCFTENGREASGLDALEWAKMAEECGAGEILLTDVDREGTGIGYDCELIKSISSIVSVPVIACGGARVPEDLFLAVTNGEADAVAISSMLHYAFIRRFAPIKPLLGEGNVEFLSSGQDHPRFKGDSAIRDIKKLFVDKGIPCRHE